MEKDKALDAALSQIERAFGKGSIMRLGQDTKIDIEAISTGSLGIDSRARHRRAAERENRRDYGPESSGKTTLALSVIAQAQKRAARARLSTRSMRWIRLMPRKSAWISIIF